MPDCSSVLRSIGLYCQKKPKYLNEWKLVVFILRSCYFYIPDLIIPCINLFFFLKSLLIYNFLFSFWTILNKYHGLFWLLCCFNIKHAWIRSQIQHTRAERRGFYFVPWSPICERELYMLCRNAYAHTGCEYLLFKWHRINNELWYHSV